MTTPIKTADYIQTEHPGIHRDMENMLNVGYGERYTVISGILTLDTSDYEKHGLLKAGHLALLIIGSIVTLICFIIRECERAPIIATHQAAEEQAEVLADSSIEVLADPPNETEQRIQTFYEAIQNWVMLETGRLVFGDTATESDRLRHMHIRYLMENSETLEHKQLCADLLWDQTPILQEKVKAMMTAYRDSGPHYSSSECPPSIGDHELDAFNVLIEATLANSAGDLDPTKPSAQLQELDDYDLTMKNWDPETGWV